MSNDRTERVRKLDEHLERRREENAGGSERVRKLDEHLARRDK